MKNHIKTISIMVLFMLVLSACGNLVPLSKAEPTTPPEPPTPEPVTVPTEEEPQADPMITCAANIDLPVEPAYPLLYCDDFENPDTSLMAGEEIENKYMDMKSEIYNGKFTVRMDVKRLSIATLMTPVTNARDFVVQIDGKMASHSGHPYHKWGLLLKKDPKDELYYYFAIDNNSMYYFMMVRGEKLTNLINGRKTDDLNSLDEGNTLTVVTNGDTFSFYINGKFQEDFKDNRVQAGDLGLYFVVDKNSIIDWEFDNLVVYAN